MNRTKLAFSSNFHVGSFNVLSRVGITFRADQQRDRPMREQIKIETKENIKWQQLDQ